MQRSPQQKHSDCGGGGFFLIPIVDRRVYEPFHDDGRVTDVSNPTGTANQSQVKNYALQYFLKQTFRFTFSTST